MATKAIDARARTRNRGSASSRRIRKIFGNIHEISEMPNLIEVQLNSYLEFLQKDVPFAKRKNSGLQAVFKEVFPIESYDEKAVLDFSHYDIVEPKLTALEAQREGQTYSAPLRNATPAGSRGGGCGRSAPCRCRSRRG